MQGDTRPDSYVVARGDTLYAIALDFGLDYRELAAWNGIADPSRILAGQRLRLSAPETSDEPQVKPLATAGGAESESLPATATPPEPATVAARSPILAEPRALTLPWSEKALAQLGGDAVPRKTASPEPRAEGRPEPKPEPRTEAKAPDSRLEAKLPAVPAAGVRPEPDAAPKNAESGRAEDWMWPARGTLAYRFGESGALKGVGIAGKAGAAVVAAAPGKVVYSGSGLRGYGNLVIIKHSEEYLTVYAHNRSLLVKEGEFVKRGQRIAEMGGAEPDRMALHFELRRFGKPVDPLTQLPGERPPS